MLGLIIFVVGATIAYNVIDPYNPKHSTLSDEEKREIERANASPRPRSQEEIARERQAALDEADNAIRAEAAERRARLKKAAVRVQTTNRNGIRVDQYVLKSGRVIGCTTTITGNSPALFVCDGNL